MFHCGDKVRVTVSDYYCDEISTDKVYVIVGIHPISMKGTFCKDALKIQFFCLDSSGNVFAILGKHLQLTGDKVHWNSSILNRSMTVSKMYDILYSPKNNVE